MLRTLLLASAFAASAVVPAVAAPAAGANWTGFYAGVNGGFGGDKFEYPVNGSYQDVVPDVDTDPTTVTGTARQSSSGFIGGAQIGYNYQAPSAGWVVGVEADIDATDIKGELSLAGDSAGSLVGGASGHITSKLDYLGTVRVRAGAPMADGRFMPYVTGGLAYGRVATSAAIDINGESGSVASLAASKTINRTGWTAGVGAEYAITDNVSFRAEYLYVDLGKHTLVSDQFAVGDGVITGSIGLKTTANVVRVAVNYRFGG